MLGTKNAIIESATIDVCEYGLLTIWLNLSYGSSGQAFGGYNLYSEKSDPRDKNVAGHFIWRVMEIAGVKNWAHLAGKTIRVKCDHAHVEAIGHIVKDDWFCPSEDFK